MAQGIREGLAELFTRNAEALARDMARDDGVGAAVRILDGEAAAARKAAAGGASRGAAAEVAAALEPAAC
jgi:hypothetical protein